MRRWAPAVVLVCLLVACTDEPAPAVRALASVATTTAPALPPAPPAAPPRPAPQLVVQGATALGAPGATPVAAVATPDGGAHVVLATPGALSLVTVEPAAAGLHVVRTVPMPALAQVWGTHLLADGEVLVAGQFPAPDRGYGFVAVDPVTGAARTTEAVPWEDGTELSSGRSALSPDGTVLTIFVGISQGDRTTDLLVEVDARTGAFQRGRDLLEEVRKVSFAEIGSHVQALLPRPAGGVVVVFDGYRVEEPQWATPTLLSYDADLEPAGAPVQLTDPPGSSSVQAVTHGSDGTVFVLTETPNGDRLVTVGPGGEVRELDVPGRTYDDGLALGPDAQWAALPAAHGARSLDLESGDVRTVDVGCAADQPVRALVSGRDPGTVLLLGRCDVPGPGTPMLWQVGVQGQE